MSSTGVDEKIIMMESLSILTDEIIKITRSFKAKDLKQMSTHLKNAKELYTSIFVFQLVNPEIIKICELYKQTLKDIEDYLISNLVPDAVGILTILGEKSINKYIYKMADNKLLEFRLSLERSPLDIYVAYSKLKKMCHEISEINFPPHWKVDEKIMMVLFAEFRVVLLTYIDEAPKNEAFYKNMTTMLSRSVKFETLFKDKYNFMNIRGLFDPFIPEYMVYYRRFIISSLDENFKSTDDPYEIATNFAVALESSIKLSEIINRPSLFEELWIIVINHYIDEQTPPGKDISKLHNEYRALKRIEPLISFLWSKHANDVDSWTLLLTRFRKLITTNTEKLCQNLVSETLGIIKKYGTSLKKISCSDDIESDSIRRILFIFEKNNISFLDDKINVSLFLEQLDIIIAAIKANTKDLHSAPGKNQLDVDINYIIKSMLKFLHKVDDIHLLEIVNLKFSYLRKES